MKTSEINKLKNLIENRQAIKYFINDVKKYDEAIKNGGDPVFLTFPNDAYYYIDPKDKIDFVLPGLTKSLEKIEEDIKNLGVEID